MKTNKIRQNLFPVLAALIWGTAFVAQSVSTDFVQPFTFNASRAIIAFFVLLIVSAVFTKIKKPVKKSREEEKSSRRSLIIGGVCCGVLLTVATNLQQAGLSDTTAGKAGFITALYVVLVPVLGIFLKRRASLQVWISVMIAVVGLYFLCIKEDFSIGTGDIYVLMCALVFSLHIMCVDHFVQKTDGIKLSCVQFLVVAVLSGGAALIFEEANWQGIVHCLWPIIYVGVFSSGVAYTLQILAQKDSDPTVVSLLLSLESVVSVIAGAIILGDKLNVREYAGCILMLGAVVLAQVPVKAIMKRKSLNKQGK